MQQGDLVANLYPAAKAELNKTRWCQRLHVALDAILLEHLDPSDEPVFILAVEQDFGLADAVATKITDSAPCDGEVVAGFLICTEAVAGSASGGATFFSKDDSGASPVTTEFTIGGTTDDSKNNHIGHVAGVRPHATEANRQFSKEDDIFVYSEAKASRSAGRFWALLVCKKI